jgi:fatty acid desaturase
MMVITRIRNIAEHAVVPDADDPLRNTRTTKANLIERIFIAPYFVNYHLEHHLLFYVPCYNLPKLHAILMSGPHAARMEVQRGYLSVFAARHHQARRRGPAGCDRQQRTAPAERRAGRRRPTILGLLRQPYVWDLLLLSRSPAGQTRCFHDVRSMSGLPT